MCLTVGLLDISSCFEVGFRRIIQCTLRLQRICFDGEM